MMKQRELFKQIYGSPVILLLLPWSAASNLAHPHHKSHKSTTNTTKIWCWKFSTHFKVGYSCPSKAATFLSITICIGKGFHAKHVNIHLATDLREQQELKCLNQHQGLINVGRMVLGGFQVIWSLSNIYSKTLSKKHLNKKLFSFGKSGGHPTVGEGEVTRTINFQNYNNVAYWTKTAQVVNCGQYYVYHLTTPPSCDLAYCGYDVPGDNNRQTNSYYSYYSTTPTTHTNKKIKQTDKQIRTTITQRRMHQNLCWTKTREYGFTLNLLPELEMFWTLWTPNWWLKSAQEVITEGGLIRDVF